MAYTPTQEELAAAPKVTLGGREYPILKLAIRQMREILGSMAEMQSQVFGGTIAQATAALSERENFDRLSEIVRVAVSRAQPMPLDDWLDLPIGLDELIAALPIVFRQAGADVDRQAAGANGVAGEAQPVAV